MSAKEIAVKEASSGLSTNTVKAPRFTPEQIAEADIEKAEKLPDLTALKKHFMPLNVEYWAAKEEGETKNVFIAGIDFHEVPDLESGEIKSIECVLMLEPTEDSLMRYINASKVLVGSIRDSISRGDIQPMSTLTPVSITYLGQKKNRSNAKLSARWKITPLIMNAD
jgi:hypothetical protein